MENNKNLMELTISHLAPYLPYNLELQYIVRDQVVTTGIMNSISHYQHETHPTRVSIGYYDEEYIWMFKPLLKPMSFLSDEDKINLYLFTKEDIDFCIENPLMLPYYDIQYLLSKHFDVFGLINNGLATIKQ